MTIGIMEVTLVGARGLKDTEFFGGIDPYVLIQYRGQERKSSIARGFPNPPPTHVHHYDTTTSPFDGQGSNPAWNEKFTFRAEYPGGDDQYKLILKIMDHDTFSSDDYLGQSTIYLKELLELGVENGKAEIHRQKYSIVASDQTFSGEIQVGITFTPKEDANAEEEFGGWKESDY